MSTLSLSQYLCREQQLHDLDPVLSRLIVSVSEACKTISFKVRNGALAGVLGMAGSENVRAKTRRSSTSSATTSSSRPSPFRAPSAAW